MSSPKDTIAKLLMKTNAGALRSELAATMPNVAPDTISTHLNGMLSAGHVEKRPSGTVNRWLITPKGRIAYSDLNADDETSCQLTNADNPPTEPIPEITDIDCQSKPEPLVSAEPPVRFDLSKPLDRALLHLCRLIKTEAELQPSISDQERKCEFLEALENLSILKPEHRDLARAIRTDLNQMEDA